eukprot:TRINITY_DN19670_c0_g2_i2.p1 TRINITY_DN19670_c0_g2~~TRINITY_DN19670_c0_g2_i2.p1  ORF type:complete len:137 (-),score=63.96 TRINITY_DN19670_c0_g2_i2:10-420(-)
MEVFTEYYAAKQTHRKLRWVHTMGKNTIEMHGFTIGGNKKKKEDGKKAKESKIHLTVSTIQAFILLMFNNNERLSLEDIASAMGMDPKELRKYLKSLTCLLYTSDAADDLLCVDLCGRRIIKKKKNIQYNINSIMI